MDLIPMDVRRLFVVFAVVIITVIVAYLLYDNRVKKRLWDQCKEYAGFDRMKLLMVGEPSNTELIEGIRRKERALIKRANALAGVLGDRDSKVPEFLDKARSTFPRFLSQKLARDVEKATRKEVKTFFQDLQTYLEDAADLEIRRNPTTQVWLNQWCADAILWIKIVDRFAFNIAWNAEIEKNKERRTK